MLNTRSARELEPSHPESETPKPKPPRSLMPKPSSLVDEVAEELLSSKYLAMVEVPVSGFACRLSAEVLKVWGAGKRISVYPSSETFHQPSAPNVQNC